MRVNKNITFSTIQNLEIDSIINHSFGRRITDKMVIYDPMSFLLWSEIYKKLKEAGESQLQTTDSIRNFAEEKETFTDREALLLNMQMDKYENDLSNKLMKQTNNVIMFDQFIKNSEYFLPDEELKFVHLASNLNGIRRFVKKKKITESSYKVLKDSVVSIYPISAKLTLGQTKILAKKHGKKASGKNLEGITARLWRPVAKPTHLLLSRAFKEYDPIEFIEYGRTLDYFNLEALGMKTAWQKKMIKANGFDSTSIEMPKRNRIVFERKVGKISEIALAH